MPIDSFRNIDEDYFDTILEEDFYFDGFIKFDESAIIKGHIKGKIESKKKIIIGPNAIIEADIYADSIECFGQIKGNIVIEDEAYFHSPSSLNGDIKTVTMTFEKGCILNGKVTMKEVEINSEDE